MSSIVQSPARQIPIPMEEALRQAEAAGARGEVPVGAVVVDIATGSILAAAGNEVEKCCRSHGARGNLGAAGGGGGERRAAP